MKERGEVVEATRGRPSEDTPRDEDLAVSVNLLQELDILHGVRVTSGGRLEGCLWGRWGGCYCCSYSLTYSCFHQIDVVVGVGAGCTRERGSDDDDDCDLAQMSY